MSDECRDGPFMLLFGKSKGGAVHRSLGMLDEAGEVVQRHPEKFCAEVLREIAPNLRTVL